MSLRTYIGNVFLSIGRSIGRSENSELAVTLSDHSINIKMVETNTEAWAWDDNLYKYGNVFLEGYANPIKPTVDHHKELENPDQADVEQADTRETDDTEEDQAGHVDLISSTRYREYMRQDLISQLLNPREQWRLIAYGIIALALVQVMTLVVSLAAAGVF